MLRRNHFPVQASKKLSLYMIRARRPPRGKGFPGLGPEDGPVFKISVLLVSRWFKARPNTLSIDYQAIVFRFPVEREIENIVLNFATSVEVAFGDD